MFFLLFVTSCEGKPCHTTTSAAAVQQAHTIDEARPCTQHRVTATASPQCDFANQNPLSKLSKHTTLMHFPFQRTQTTPTCSKTSATALRTVEKSVLNQDSGRSLARLLAKTDAAVHLPSLRCSPNGQTALLSRHQRTGLCNSTLLARMQHAPPLLQKHSMHYILLAQHGSTCGKKN